MRYIKAYENKKIVIPEYSFTIHDIEKYFNEQSKYYQTKTKTFLEKYLINNIISVHAADINYEKIKPIKLDYNPAYIEQYSLYEYPYTLICKLLGSDVITIYNVSGDLRRFIEKLELKKITDKYNL